MNFAIRNRHLFMILIIFLLLHDFAFLAGAFTIPYYFFVVVFFVIYCLVRHFNLIANNMKRMYMTKTGKHLTFFILWILLGIFVSIVMRTFIPKSFFTNFIGTFFCSNLFPFLIPALTLPFMLSYKRLCKYLLVMYFCVFSLGIIEYIGNTNNITFIQNFFIFFVNRLELVADITRVFSESCGRYRISGIFHEPGALAAFVFISSPIVYFLCTSKIRILKIRVVDIFVKITTLILMAICFIGTQSPINLCFMLIFLGFVLLKKIIDIKIKYKGIILFSLFCITVVIAMLALNILSIQNIDITDTYLNRILRVLENFTSMTKLVDAEPSLATRICNWSAEFVIALKHPLFGVGYGNVMHEWAQAILSLPFPITQEIYLAAIFKAPAAASTMFWKLLAETGFVGTVLFYTFLFNIIFAANKAKMYYNNLQKGLISSLQLSLFLCICVSYYVFLQPIFWVYFGILESMILYAKKNIIITKLEK